MQGQLANGRDAWQLICDRASVERGGGAAAGRQALSIGLVLSLLALLWSVSSGVQGLIKSLNLIYDEKETRGFVKLRGLSLLLTLGGLLMAVKGMRAPEAGHVYTRAQALCHQVGEVPPVELREIFGVRA